MPVNQTNPSNTPEPAVSLRVRANEFVGARLARALARPGTLFEPAYLAAFESVINREVARINRLDIGSTSYYGLLSLYPELQRAFFIHIPKCGGTSIRLSLVDEYCCAPVPLPGASATHQSIDYIQRSLPEGNPWRRLLDTSANTTDRDLAQGFLRAFTGYRLIRNPGRAFILGHKFAREMVPFYREERDFFFTTVRDPAEALKSMLVYRVAHTLANRRRADSLEFLQSLQIDYPQFEELVAQNPEALTQLALARKTHSLANFLSMGSQTDCESVWTGLREKTVFVAHMSEQSRMLAALFGNRPRTRRKNRSGYQRGLAAEFAAAVQDDWIRPYVDPESRRLYDRLAATGIIGFWEAGGTISQYRQLIERA